MSVDRSSVKKIDRVNYTNAIMAIKNLTLPVERVKTEDIPNLMRILNWGLPDERKIINSLCKQLRIRNKLNYLTNNLALLFFVSLC